MNPQQCGMCWKFLPDAKQAILGNPHDMWVCGDCVDKHVRQIKNHRRRSTVMVVDDE